MESRWTSLSISESSQCCSSSGPRGVSFAKSYFPGFARPTRPMARKSNSSASTSPSIKRLSGFAGTWISTSPGSASLYDDQGSSIRAYKVPTTSYVVVVDRTGKVAYTGTGGTQDLDKVLRGVIQD